MKFAGTANKARRPEAGFTLAEVLAALLFLAIVIPVAVQAFHVAAVSGEVAVRRSQAVRIADGILNEALVTTNWQQSATGSRREGGEEFQWRLRSELWPGDAGMELVTAEVSFTAQGRDYSVHLSTLADSQSTLMGGTP
jgi:Tfp pilus assembly protein PilV